ncbi:ATP synthase subunit I [Paenibacillus pini]|uniref:ATP synthase protein I n=1 Tax=Paenibacillus pini JCM 16418 TaxID=1236976 RepID=W7Z7A2_9BACL|nr:ATP synthase subunit I [Paenibacillus pini]GAF10199.1 hypothetical protein JCM16418_4376 [Paenibacillus pini JCM 16418]
MSELSKYQKVLVIVTLCFLALCLLVSVILPAHRDILFGVVLGSAVSCINAFYLGMKVKQVSASAAGESQKRASLGFLSRAALSLLAVMIAYKNPAYLNMVAVAGSLLVAPVLLIIIGIRLSRKEI